MQKTGHMFLQQDARFVAEVRIPQTALQQCGQPAFALSGFALLIHLEICQIFLHWRPWCMGRCQASAGRFRSWKSKCLCLACPEPICGKLEIVVLLFASLLSAANGIDRPHFHPSGAILSNVLSFFKYAKNRREVAVMGSLVARTVFISPYWPNALARIWRSVLQFRSYSDQGLDGHVSTCLEASSTAHLSRESPAGASTTHSFRAYRLIENEHAYPVTKFDGYRIKRPSEAKRPVSNQDRSSRNVAQESSRFPRQGFVCGPELLPFQQGNVQLTSPTTAGRAIAALKNRQQQGQSIDSYALIDALKQCSQQKDLVATRQLHDCIIQSGMDKHPYVATTLLNVYIKCGRLRDARRVFDGLLNTDRNVRTWNAMIGAYARSGCGVEAYRLFVQMNLEGFLPDAITCLSILNYASASAGALEWVREVHSHALKAGLLESDFRVGTALVHMYAKSGSVHDARLVFDRLEKHDVITWNVMIGAYAESGCGVEAYRLFDRMKREGFIPDAIIYLSILNYASASAGALEWVREVHSHAFKAGLESDVRVGNALVHMYAKSGSVDDARLVFDRLEKRDVITWSVMIGAYAESGSGVEAYRLFDRMKREGFIPNAITCLSILNASASAGALEWLREVHRHALKAGLESDVRVGTALVHMYAKSGSVDDARLVFDRLEKRDVITWNVMIGGLAEHGRGLEALELFKRMNADCVKPDESSFVAVLSACSHAGLVNDGRKLFAAMKQDYGVEATVVHYTCMVDILGRAGHLEEAKLLIDNMPMEANAVTWKALLGACRTHNCLKLGELAAKEVLKLEPNASAAYVLLSNIYSSTGRWEKVVSVRNMMEKRDVWKEPGLSWIAVDNKIHEFVARDTSHPEATAIYSLLEELTENLKARGYIPDTRLVLHNVNDEDKELALCAHSEKLAIAYGLLRVPREEAIRVWKNLRICSDCHTATKLISEVTGREIIAKDTNRFHHFKDGVCSCGDYW